MADIRNITILPTQSVQGVQPVAQGASQSSAATGNLPPGTVLSGFIVNRDAAGNPVLRTNNGDITFQSNLFLKIGSEVVVRIENTGGNTQAHILSIDGHPPEAAVAQSSFSEEPDIISQNLGTQTTTANAAAQPAATTPSAPAITITGTVLSQPQAATAAQPVPTGTQLTLKIVSLTAPASNVPEELAALAPPPATVTTQTTPASYAAYARATGQQPASAQPVANMVTPNAVAPTPQAADSQIPVEQGNAPVIPTPASTNATGAQTLSATVIGNDSSGESMVQTPVGIVRLTGVILPTGSTAVFEITETTPPAQTAIVNQTTAALPAPITELAQQWTSLQQIFSLLGGQDTLPGFDFSKSGIASASTQAASAQPAITPQTISVGLMLFMAAMQSGDFRSWVGKNNVDWLERQGHDALIKKAEGEFMSLSRQFTEAQPQHWQPVFFPVAVAGMLTQLRLFVKRGRKQGGNQPQKKQEDTRFVVEVDMSQLGEIQMDGFVRRDEKNVQFDLMIRSLIPLSKQIQQDIMQIYNNTGSLTGYKGSLLFQAVKEFPVNPMEDIAAHMAAVMA